MAPTVAFVVGTRPEITKATLAGLVSVVEGDQVRDRLERRERPRAQLESFVDAVRHDRPPVVDPEDARWSLAVAQRLLESAATGQDLAGPALALTTNA